MAFLPLTVRRKNIPFILIVKRTGGDKSCHSRSSAMDEMFVHAHFAGKEWQRGTKKRATVQD
jgi:hypothetical protein